MRVARRFLRSTLLLRRGSCKDRQPMPRRRCPDPSGAHAPREHRCRSLSWAARFFRHPQNVECLPRERWRTVCSHSSWPQPSEYLTVARDAAHQRLLNQQTRYPVPRRCRNRRSDRACRPPRSTAACVHPPFPHRWRLEPPYSKKARTRSKQWLSSRRSGHACARNAGRQW